MGDSDPSAGKRGDGSPQSAGPAESPSANVVSEVVAKIQSEPLLFIIAVIVLIGGVAAGASSLGSGNFRLIVVVIAILAVLAMLGYYTLQVLQLRQQRQAAGQSSSRHGVNASFAGKDMSGKVNVVKVGEMPADVDVQASAKVENVKRGGEVTVFTADTIGGSPGSPRKPAEEPDKPTSEDPQAP